VTAPARGWPVLVGAGRRRDFSTLLAPDFLVAGREYGVLSETLRPFPDGDPPRLVQTPIADGHWLGVVYATYPLTSADLTEPAPGSNAAPRSGEPPRPLRDEHSRPLRLMYGFASPDVRFDEPAEADLELARTFALRAYRRFLDDEEGFTVLSSQPFALRSRTTPVRLRAVPSRLRATPPRRRAAPLPGRSVPTPAPAPTGSTRRRRQRLLWLGAAVITVAIVAVLALVLSRPEPDPPCLDRTAQPSPTAGAVPSLECRPDPVPPARPRVRAALVILTEIAHPDAAALRARIAGPISSS
jgi:hypothetical protein